MKILSASNPQWADAAHTMINLDVTFDIIGAVPFTTSASDIEPHGRDLFTRASAGEFGAVTEYAPALTELKAAKLAELDVLLGDWKTPRIALANGAGNPKITFIGADQIQVVILAWLGLASSGGTSTTLTDVDGNSGTVTKALLDSFVPLWVAENNRIRAAYVLRKTAIYAAISTAELGAVDTTTPL